MSALIDRPPKEGARMLALAYLDQAIAASERLDDPEDSESLHDFRVGLRRLRTCLREYDRWLSDTVRPKDLERIRALARSTGEGRDSEVQMSWLQKLGEGLDEKELPGSMWMQETLAHKKEEAYRAVRKKGRARLRKIDKTLRPRLKRYVEKREVGGDPRKGRFGYITGERILTRARRLEKELRKVRSIADEARAHRARIHGKRLRYLLEPMRGELEGVKGTVKRLKQLQDLLGWLNDLHVLSASLGEAIEVAAIDRARRLRRAATAHGDAKASVHEALSADERPGLLAFLDRAQTRKAELFDRLLQSWLAEDGALSALMEEVKELALRLEGEDGEEELPTEIERKYLLRAMPEIPAELPTKVIEIEQGYLPGDKLNERLRRKKVVGARRASYTRCVKLGRGLKRIEVEESTTAAIYKAMWPLTEGKRVTKRRHKVEVEGLTWEIDEFTDRALFLAEVELPTEETDSPAPEWLEAVLEREVTGEDAYVNLNLAK